MSLSKLNEPAFDAYLGLGANLGDCELTLQTALRALAAAPGVADVVPSSLYRTTPVGRLEQPDFFNLVAGLRTALSAQELLALCLRIEASLGRERSERWGPRVIDLDVLWHREGPCTSADLCLPHPRMTERAFVMVPLAELAPGLVVSGVTVSEWARRLGDQGVNRVDTFSGRTTS